MQLQRPDLLRDNNYINGQWQAAASGRRFPVENPANGEKLTEVADGGTADMDAAITAADAAQAAWQSETPKTRAQILQRWYQLIIEHRRDLAAILTAEQGKVLAEADAEIGYGANYVEWFSEEAKRIDGDILAAPSRDKRLLVIKQAIGVVAAITPWNFPNAMITRKAAPALAARTYSALTASMPLGVGLWGLEGYAIVLSHVTVMISLSIVMTSVDCAPSTAMSTIQVPV